MTKRRWGVIWTSCRVWPPVSRTVRRKSSERRSEISGRRRTMDSRTHFSRGDRHGAQARPHAGDRQEEVVRIEPEEPLAHAAPRPKRAPLERQPQGAEVAAAPDRDVANPEETTMAAIGSELKG